MVRVTCASQVDMCREGFDPSKLRGDAVYVRDPQARAYVRLTPEVHRLIVDGAMRL